MQSYRFASSVAAIAAVAGGLVIGAGSAAADDLPAIKVSATNAVPACATPGRLQAYLKSRNPALDARFETIAVDYMRHGEALGVRWDYAFFQMIMETGQLSFKNGSRSGDVKPSQNNFAGLGATGGVPGESFPDVATGARAHLEHVLLYSGEKLASPVAERTRKVQDWGVLTDWQKGIKHPITYADLASKWAPKSKAYTDSLEQIAAKFFDDQCKKADPHPEFAAAARGQSWQPVMQTAAVAAPAVTPNAPATPAAQTALPPATAFDQPAEKAAEKVSGTDLARKAVSDGNNVRSGLGSGLAQQVKILNAPSAEEAAPAPAVAAQQPPAVTPPMASAAPQGKAPATATTKPQATKTAAVGAAPKAMAPAPEQPARAPEAATQGPAVVATPATAAQKCRVWTASYGGQRAVIVSSTIDQVANFTVLDVNEGQEAREADAFIAAYAKGGAVTGQFVNQDKALEKAFELCPEG